MARKYIDCREIPSDSKCTVAISADGEELIEVAVQHAVKVHGHQDTADFQQMSKHLARHRSLICAECDRRVPPCAPQHPSVR